MELQAKPEPYLVGNNTINMELIEQAFHQALMETRVPPAKVVLSPDGLLAVQSGDFPPEFVVNNTLYGIKYEVQEDAEHLYAFYAFEV